MRRPHWRKMTWVLISWCALIIVWAAAGAAGNDCAHQTSLIWFMSRPREQP